MWILLLSVLIARSPSAARADESDVKLCGQTGSIEARIRDCDTIIHGWSLVSRADKEIEIWQEPPAPDAREPVDQILWGAKIPGLHSYAEALGLCQSPQRENDLLPGVQFSLPSEPDYRRALHANLSKVLLSRRNFWTSTPVATLDAAQADSKDLEPKAWLFLGLFKNLKPALIKTISASVRCIARVSPLVQPTMITDPAPGAKPPSQYP